MNGRASEGFDQVLLDCAEAFLAPEIPSDASSYGVKLPARPRAPVQMFPREEPMFCFASKCSPPPPLELGTEICLFPLQLFQIWFDCRGFIHALEHHNPIPTRRLDIAHGAKHANPTRNPQPIC